MAEYIKGKHVNKREDESIKNLALRESRKSPIKVKLIEKFDGGGLVYQALDHTLYYKLGKDIYPKIPTGASNLPALYITLEQISIEEFNRLYALQGNHE